MRPAFLLPALLNPVASVLNPAASALNPVASALNPVTSALNPVVSAVSSLGPLVLHETRSVIPTGFTAVGLADPDQILNLRIALTQNNISGLETVLYDVSTPGSPSYGKYLSKDEVNTYIAPSDNSTKLVQQWLSQNNLTATSLTSVGNWLQVSMPVSQANTLLAANFSVFNHPATGTKFTRTLAYSIPAELENHIQVIYPTTSFAITNRLSPTMKGIKATKTTMKNRRNVKSRQTSTDFTCDTVVVPSCLQTLYNLPPGPTGSPASSNTLAVSGFLNQFANQDDLTLFLQDFRPDVDSSTSISSQVGIDNGTNSENQADAGIEASLDIQYTVGLVSTVPVTFISVGEDNNDGGLDGFLDIINALLAEDNSTLPTVLTTSYGFNEDSISSDLAIQLCQAYIPLGARGVTLLFASGDGGVSGTQNDDTCTTKFVPTFPATCPYITAVGGTTGFPTEIAANFSSGGFSNVFARPSYQDTAVTNYLTNTLGSTNAELFNTSGRAYPDVSAQSMGLQVVVDGVVQSIDGTSASSPIFASVIALLNDLLLQSGRGPLGFLNPLLYGANFTSVLTDITSGSNPGCNTNGFPAAPGWDPVTGLGTPNFLNMTAVLGLP